MTTTTNSSPLSSSTSIIINGSTLLSSGSNPSILDSYRTGSYEIVPEDYYFSDPKQAALLASACYSVDKGVRNEVFQVSAKTFLVVLDNGKAVRFMKKGRG